MLYINWTNRIYSNYESPSVFGHENRSGVILQQTDTQKMHENIRWNFVKFWSTLMWSTAELRIFYTQTYSILFVCAAKDWSENRFTIPNILQSRRINIIIYVDAIWSFFRIIFVIIFFKSQIHFAANDMSSSHSFRFEMINL